MPVQLIVDTNTINMNPASILCQCGKSVNVYKMQSHKNLKTHHQLIIKRQHIQKQGGQNGLAQCDCGMFITWKLLPTHVEGNGHLRLLAKKLKPNSKICPQCNLAYNCHFNAHKLETDHRSNSSRKLMFINQRSQVNMLQFMQEARIQQSVNSPQEIYELQKQLYNISAIQVQNEIRQISEAVELEKAQYQQRLRHYLNTVPQNLREIVSRMKYI